MITTARAARFLQRLPDADAAALLDAVHEAAADPLANPRHCKHLGPDLWEARVSLPPSRAFRLMFSYRRDGVPVLLSACLKKSHADHQREIDHARAELASDEPQGVAVPHKLPTDAPFDLKTPWLYDANGRQWKIVHHTRQRIVVATDAGRVSLKRANLERDGYDIAVGGMAYRVCHPRYSLPHESEPQEQTA